MSCCSNSKSPGAASIAVHEGPQQSDAALKCDLRPLDGALAGLRQVDVGALPAASEHPIRRGGVTYSDAALKPQVTQA